MNPTNENIILILKNIIDNSIGRKEAADWATRYFLDDSLEFDNNINNVLEKISAIDLISTDRDFLYANEDIKEWLEEFKIISHE